MSTKKRKNRDFIMGRYVLISVGILAAAIAVACRLFSTTVIYSKDWENKVDSLLVHEADIQPERGKILADDRTVLAADVNFYIPRMDLRAEGIKEDTLKAYLPAMSDSLAKYFPYRSSKEWRDYIWNGYENRNTIKGARSYPLGNRLSYGQVMLLRKMPFFSKRRDKTGLYWEKVSRRCNPYGKMAARSIGKFGYDTVHKRPAGVSGLEFAFDSLLRGVPGKAQTTQFNKGIGQYEVVPAKRGYDVMTTINVELQDIVEEELQKVCEETEAYWGTAVLMEVSTGKIKAISNLQYSPKLNKYVEGTNHAVIGYEPGSVMKPISMMVALEDGIVNDINAQITTGRSYAYAGARPITDAHAYTSMSIADVIAYSSNIGMAKIILRKYESQPGMFHHRLRQMGFFDPMHIGIAGENIPIVDSLGNKNWDKIKLSRMAYGYSTYIPPLSTLAMYNAIANDGKYVRPRLVERFMRDGEPDSIVPLSYIREQVCTPTNAAKLRKMLFEVVENPHGTGKSLKNDKVHIAGKTGTCYVYVSAAEARDLHRDFGYTGPVGYTAMKRLSFCGFFPYENPKYSCIVVMQRANRGAAASSGRVLKNIALKLYSKGLLNNSSDFRNDAQAKSGGSKAMLYATVNGTAGRSELVSTLGLSNYKYYNTPKREGENLVPDVIGLSVREAIARLEDAGLKVRFTGAGFVVSQSLRPGTHFVKGQRVDLRLRL